MRHRISGRQLSRNTSHRKALRRNMAISLFQHGAIRTTEAKAKELRGFVEKLITLARKNTLHARRMVSAELGNRGGVRGQLFDNEENLVEKTVLQKIFDEIGPRYVDRPGGYTRIVRLAERRIGDAGKQVVIQLVESAAEKGEQGKAGSRRRRRAGKRQEAAGATAETSSAEAEESK